MKSWLMLAALIIAVRGSPVVKRSDDSNPLEAVVNKLSSDLQALQAEVAVHRNLFDLFKAKIGFMARAGHEHTVGDSVIVKFDSVQYNEGNAYNPGTGIFTAPVAGMYTFLIKTEVNPGNHLGLRVMKEGSEVLYIYGSDHDTFQTPSGQVVLHLTQGEKAWAETHQSGPNEIKTLTRFGGFLVHPDA